MMLTNLSTEEAPKRPLIHPTAVIHPGADIHPNVAIGPYSVIGEHVKISAQTVIGAHVVIEGPTEIGVGNRIFPGAVIGLEPQDLKYKGEMTQVKIGDYNQIREFVTINQATNANKVTYIGNNNLLMAYVHVAHDCVIEDEVIISNSVALAGHIHIESQAKISGVLGIHQFVHIGKLAMVGGMTRIERDVPPYMMVEGNPSRIRSLNLIGLKRAGLSEDEIKQLREVYRLLYQSSKTFKEALDELYPLCSSSQHLLHLHQFLKSSIGGGKRRGPIPAKG
jgi:UDP-N-acetylglucosamine acyltransferase